MKEANLPDQETIDWMNEELTRFRPEDGRTVADEIAKYEALRKITHRDIPCTNGTKEQMKKKILLLAMSMAMASESRADIADCQAGEDDFDYHTKRNPDLQRVPYYRKSKREVYRKR